jgi:hypothetical protein
MLSKMNILPEGVALLTVLRASLSEPPPATERLSPSLDWEAFSGLARHHRLEPLLHYGLRHSLLTGIPDRVCAEWEARRRISVASVLYHQESLKEIAAAFEDRRVPFALLKGEALSKALYPQDGLRPYGDIDLLIRPETYESAKAILMGLGFRLRQAAKEMERLRLFGEIEFDKDVPIPLTVDLHWDTLMTSWEPQSLLTDDDTWASLDHVRLGNRIIPILQGEVLLIYLCVHFAFHHAFDGLLLLCDLFLMLRRDAEKTDWDRLIVMANRCQCRHALYCSLYFAKSLMAAPVPDAILDLLRPHALIRGLMPTTRLLFRDRVAPQMLERYVKFLLIDTLTGRRRALQAWFQSTKRLHGR